MDGDAETREALAETTVFLSYFKDMPDHRQAGKVTYPLDEILLLCLLAVLAGAEAFTDIARFGEKKLDLLRRFRPYRDARPRMIIWAIFSARSTRKPSSALRRLGRGADQDADRGHRHRRQDIAPLLSEEGLERADPHGVGLRRAAASRHGTGRGGGKIQ
jgi:DDE_Tnp_1-associated